MLRTSNPAFSAKNLRTSVAHTAEDAMTINGSIQKTGLLVLLAFLGATYTWGQFSSSPELAQTWMFGGAIGGFIAAMVIVFKRNLAKYVAPIYAILEGLFLGAISAYFNAMFPAEGIVMRAIALTFGVLFAMLMFYRAGIIKPTERFRSGVLAATGGVALVYFVTFIANMFGANMTFMYESSLLGIGISLVIVVIAALNLILDFDFIEKGAKAGLNKDTEWYAAFGLMVTLVWLYIEILRLLSLLAGRD
ncbi:MAG: Bax inhibitor-1/YccA family protein [Salinivirgaceae bacterium]|jgi:uncharacterized YccA/Bax inhibitor family protein|nr:Bax inhibitor-1/YccA family protein [Salinivirgaceae bacterium]